MTILYTERLSDSPYIETVTQGRTISAGATIRPAEISWHMVITRYEGNTHFILAGPWAESGCVSWGEGAEIIWIRFKTGTFMPHLPTRNLLDREITLPEAGGKSFWLYSSARQLPAFDTVETFVNRLAREEVLVRDPIVSAALNDEPHDMALRTVRDRFLRSTGLTLSHIRQVERARQAQALLEQGASILDTVYEAGYFDQPHLTRSLKRFIGYTPAQIIRIRSCYSLDTIPVSNPLELMTASPA